MKTFPVLVIEEATNLKIHATPEEIAKLDIETLAPQDNNGCVYGQMTGYCHSLRAIDLIEKCASRVYHAADGCPGESKNLNGKPFDMKRKDKAAGLVTYWSPIEVFIDQDEEEMNAKLISFIKGEIDTLA